MRPLFLTISTNISMKIPGTRKTSFSVFAFPQRSIQYTLYYIQYTGAATYSKDLNNSPAQQLRRFFIAKDVYSAKGHFHLNGAAAYETKCGTVISSTKRM